jgi:diguanylate cyclase (GGDEF)-like protein
VYLTAFPFFFHRPGLLGLERSAVITAEMLWSLLVFGLLIWGMFSVVQLTSVSEHRLANKAETDELTGLLNRAGYDRLLEELDLNSTTLLLVDTDKFKGINDTFGHETGDRVLQKISRSLIGNFRQNDYVCRIGGDEFAILMVNVGTLENEKITEKIRYINRELAGSIDDELPAVSVSVGVAHGAGAESWSELFRHADAVLYRVKQNGGRGCMVHNTESA